TSETTIETPPAPVETPVLEAAPEATPLSETASEKGKEVYVDGEPLPHGVLPPPQETPAAVPVEATRPALVEIPQDPIQHAIEKKLEAGVGEAFAALEPLAQEVFKVEGEHTGAAVRALLAARTLGPQQVKGIFVSVHRWLSLLPDTNPWWIEQEAHAKMGALVRVRE
ncbi:MAG: hypothetical protein AAB579_01700, partial [Patescibacteria group bacterium]